VLWTSIFKACADRKAIATMLWQSPERYADAIDMLVDKNLISVQAAGPAPPIAPQAPHMALPVAQPMAMPVPPSAPFAPSASTPQLPNTASASVSQPPLDAQTCTPSIQAVVGPAPTMLAAAAAHRAIASMEIDLKVASGQRDALSEAYEEACKEREVYKDCLQSMWVAVNQVLDS
jgi:hypothetical protein